MRKGRSERRQEQLAKEPRKGQLAKGDAEMQSTSENRGERSALSGLSRECQSQQKSERRLLKPDELHRARANQREKMSALLVPFCRSFVLNTRPRKSADARGMQCHKTTFLALGTDPSPYCLFVLLCLPLSLGCTFLWP